MAGWLVGWVGSPVDGGLVRVDVQDVVQTEGAIGVPLEAKRLDPPLAGTVPQVGIGLAGFGVGQRTVGQMSVDQAHRADAPLGRVALAVDVGHGEGLTVVDDLGNVAEALERGHVAQIGPQRDVARAQGVGVVADDVVRSRLEVVRSRLEVVRVVVVVVRGDGGRGLLEGAQQVVNLLGIVLGGFIGGWISGMVGRNYP